MGVPTFLDPFLNEKLIEGKTQFEKRRSPSDIYWPPNIAKKIPESYKNERGRIESILYELAIDSCHDNFGDAKIIIKLHIEGYCENSNHKNLVQYDKPLNDKLLWMLQKSDYELTWGHRRECPEAGCRKKVIPVLSYIKYAPIIRGTYSQQEVYEFSKNLLWISTRIKGDDRLCAKIADGITGVNQAVRPGSLHPAWNPRDFAGIQYVTPDKDSCITQLENFKNKPDVIIPEPIEESIDNYFEHPKVIEEIGSDGKITVSPNPYQAIHTLFIYKGMPGEAKFIPEHVLRIIKTGKASHETFGQRQEEARKKFFEWPAVYERIKGFLNSS